MPPPSEGDEANKRRELDPDETVPAEPISIREEETGEFARRADPSLTESDWRSALLSRARNRRRITWTRASELLRRAGATAAGRMLDLADLARAGNRMPVGHEPERRDRPGPARPLRAPGWGTRSENNLSSAGTV